MDASVESLCNALARGRVLPPETIRTLRQRWRQQAGANADDPTQFLRWLVASQLLSEYQAAVLAKGQVEQLCLDRYRVVDRIGRGRLAGVYKAQHETGQTVAIKILPPSKAKDADTLARFKREARLSQKLRHPNAVRAFESGKAGNLNFIVLEYLEGETLKEVLERRGKLPPGEAARLMHQTLLGLQHVHEKGLVHRDIEPGNLMLIGSRPESTLQATVKILDIGMGRALFDENATDTEGDNLVTAPGTILGTSDYMAPEQARDSRAADIRSDIYSVGCVLFHCLAGEPPFPEKNKVRAIIRHSTEQPRRIRDLNPAVPDGLQQILDWMMAKDPNQRYPTPERAAQALEVFLASGADVVSIDQDPGMQVYLEWLTQHAPSDQEIDVEPVAPVSVPIAAPVATPSAPPIAAPVAAVPRPAANGASAAPPPLPKSPPARRAAAAPEAPPPRKRDADEEILFGLTTRDFIMLGAGVAFVGIVIIAVVLFNLFRRPEKEPAEN